MCARVCECCIQIGFVLGALGIARRYWSVYVHMLTLYCGYVGIGINRGSGRRAGMGGQLVQVRIAGRVVCGW